MRPAERNTLAGPGEAGVIARATCLLEAVAEGADTIRGLARATGMAPSSVHRLVGQLVDVGVLARADSRIQLGAKLFELGAQVPVRRDLADAAEAVMEDLREATHRRIHLAVLDGTDVVYVRILGAQSGIASKVGGRIPAHATGVGKVILAYSSTAAVQACIDTGLHRVTPRTIHTPQAFTYEMRKIRTVGMALDLEESTAGVSCVAAPVFGADRKVRAGLSVTGPTRSIDPGTLGIAVRTAAFTLSRTLRDSGI
ncbi:IclR family transcriptional regulator [Marihabitans asiaticum]